MKTKIIYISGSESFSVDNVRTAFDEVRKTLGLSSNTVLFGVPIDTDGVDLASQGTEQAVQDTDSIPVESPVETVSLSEKLPEIVPINEPDVITEKPKRVRKPSVAKIPEPIPVQDVSIQEDPVVEIATPEPVIKEPDEIIPILSFLGSGANASEPSEEKPAAASITVTETIQTTVKIEDTLNEEIPEPEIEKTLEQLLEKMSPLREDKRDKKTDNKPIHSETLSETPPRTDDMNKVLEKLAAEFAERQNEITLPDGGGKIGKLRNILPFKKAKKEDSGLMGDLFGWAGIAANDDEFNF